MTRRLIVLFFALFSLFLLFPNNSYAQETPTEPDSSSIPSVFESPVTLNPEPAEIHGNTPSVEITFTGLEPNSEWHICSKTDSCRKAEDKKSADENGTLTMTVCAANDERLRRDDCDENDYFHEGKVYAITLFEDEDQERRGPYVRFFVNHFFPDVTLKTSGGPLEVVITGDRRPGPNKNKNRNNYQVVVEGEDRFGNKYKQDKCVTIEQNGGSATATFGRVDKNDTKPLQGGEYLVKVNERVNEGGIIGTFDPCNGGFTYWHINTIVNNSGALPEQISCLSTSDQNAKECEIDPNDSDLKGFNKLLEELNEISTFNLRCNQYGYNEKGELECLEINTAIGSIPTNPIAFIERIFSIVLSIAGIAALGLIIYGGYVYMVSRGDPERIKGARETITSAVIGLLFIIFSLVILQVIAGDILQIPGFN